MTNEQSVNSIELNELAVTNSYITKNINQILDSSVFERNEQSLSENEEKYHFLFNRLNDAVLMFKINENMVPGKFLIVNEAATHLLGYSKDELLEMRITDLYDEKNRTKAKEMVVIVYNQGKYVFEIEQINKFGCSLPVEVNSHKFELGKEKYIISIVRDNQEKTLFRNKQEELLKERSLLLDIIAHDLRNQSMIALGYLDSYLTFEDSSYDERLDYLKNTKSAIRRIGSLLDNLAAKIRRELNTQTQLTPVNILEAVINTDIVLKELFPKKEITIDLDNITQNNFVLADKLFEQLLLNLFTNAVKNTPGDNIKITIKFLYIDKRRCFLSIIDYGKGIPSEKKTSIIQMLESRTIVNSTSGLGLHIVKTLVDKYGGKIWIENRVSDDYSKGTIFKIGLFTAD